MSLEVPPSRECPICLETPDTPITFGCHQDPLCYPCFITYLETQLKSMSYVAGKSIRCPVCESNQVPLEAALEYVEGADRDRIDRILFQTYLRQTGDVERCPLSTCEFAYLPEKCLIKKELSCPMCYTDLARPFVFSLTPLITFIYITFMTNNCPRCEIPIDRISGCYHMTCSCQHEFCWYCLKDYKHTAGSRYKTHNQKDCLFLLVTKFIVLLFVGFSLGLAYWGNEAFNAGVAYFGKICLGAIRALAIDGAIALQLIALNHSLHRANNARKLLFIFIAMDALALFIIFLFGDIGLTLYIIGVSLMIAGLVGFIAILVEFSVNTWFNYIR